MHAAKGIAQYASRAAKLGAVTRESDRFLVEALFLTVTNVNFDDARFLEALQRAVTVLEGIKQIVSPDTKVTYVQGCDVTGTDPNTIA